LKDRHSHHPFPQNLPHLMSWEIFTEDLDTQDTTFSAFLPSSLKEVWAEPAGYRAQPRPPPQHPFVAPADTTFPTTPTSPQRSPYIGSAPPAQARFPGSIDTSSATGAPPPADRPDAYFSVYFHQNRTEVLASKVEFDEGEMVITEADRGVDLGQVIGRGARPAPRQTAGLRKIIRKALRSEIDLMAAKEQKERHALGVCRAKVNELALPMDITGAEYQFDGKKLTFYYTATKYVDFRNLVRILFRTFGTRIWMMWYDGGVPVKDVLTRSTGDLQ
jgi:hypothetical protein